MSTEADLKQELRAALDELAALQAEALERDNLVALLGNPEAENGLVAILGGGILLRAMLDHGMLDPAGPRIEAHIQGVQLGSQGLRLGLQAIKAQRALDEADPRRVTDPGMEA